MLHIKLQLVYFIEGQPVGQFFQCFGSRYLSPGCVMIEALYSRDGLVFYIEAWDMGTGIPNQLPEGLYTIIKTAAAGACDDYGIRIHGQLVSLLCRAVGPWL